MKSSPNVVFIDCHDLGTVLGCYGSQHVPSPNIDRLAAEGALFSNYFATAPICIPSRAGMYIGRYPHTVGCYGQDAYDDDQVCMAVRLREHGYRTFLSGWNVPNPPEWAGYESRLPYGPSSERTRHFFRQRAEADDGPFLAHFSFHLIHRPFRDTFSQFVAEAVEVPPFLPDTEIVRQDLACLYYKIGQLDRHVGRILEAIQENAFEENTIVVFTTDHGPAIARAKHTLYDPGIRTALLIRYPPLIHPGSRYGTLLSNVDLLPTLMEMAGLTVPPGVHGRGFQGLLTGEDYTRRDEVYAEHTWGRRAGLWYHTPARCLRTSRYKLIRNYTETPPYIDTDWLGRFGPDREMIEERYGDPAPQYELYDLRDDPWEMKDQGDDPAYTDLREKLADRLTGHLQQTNDAILNGLVPNKEDKPDVPLWERQADGSYRLRAYHRDEGSDVPFGEPLGKLRRDRLDI